MKLNLVVWTPIAMGIFAFWLVAFPAIIRGVANVIQYFGGML